MSERENTEQIGFAGSSATTGYGNTPKFVNIGFGNRVAVDRIITVASPDAAPIKRLVQDAKKEGRVIDCSCGRKTRSVLVTDSDHVILSALAIISVANRLNGGTWNESEDETDELASDIISGEQMAQ